LGSAIALSALFFGTMHFLLTFLFSSGRVINQQLIPPLALVAGLGLSLMVYDHPIVGKRPSRWFLRLLIVAVVFSLVQSIFAWVEVEFGPEGYGSGLMFSWPGSVYRSYVPDALARRGLESLISTIQAVEHWNHYAAIVDFALSGIALAAGLSLGLNRAADRYRERVSLLRRAEESRTSEEGRDEDETE
jgi:hypothetical protein